MANSLRLPLATLRRRAEPRSIVGDVILEDLGVGDVLIVDGQVSVDLQAEARGADVVVVGSVCAVWVGTCRRCLDELCGDVNLTVREVLSEDHGASSRSLRSEEADGDAYALGVDEADVEPIVRDAVLLALPLSPVCSEDCDGPDPERFPTRSVDDDGVPETVSRDPRWAVLDLLASTSDDVAVDGELAD